MSDFIPFIQNTRGSLQLARTCFAGAYCYRVTADICPEVQRIFDPSSLLWVDPGIDGLESPKSLLPPEEGEDEDDKPWRRYISQFPNVELIADPSFQKKPAKAKVRDLTYAVLDHIETYKPMWITVPQLPVRSPINRNILNNHFAESAGAWHAERKSSAALILPLILTKHGQYAGRTQRGPLLKNFETRFKLSRAHGTWVVDAGLKEDYGPETMKGRYESLAALHESLNEKIVPDLRIAGPYWGANLMLWARDLIDYPAVGIGNAYQYFPAGSRSSSPKPRIPIMPLRRRAVRSPELANWLRDAIKTLGNHPEAEKFGWLLRNFQRLKGDEARIVMAQSYRKWVDCVEAMPKPGRRLAFFQDLSAAYALGKILPTMDAKQAPTRNPEAVVEPLMLTSI